MGLITDELKRIKEQMARAEEIRQELPLLRKTEKKLVLLEAALHRSFRDENEDVEKLEKASPKRLFFSAVGKLSERLEKEEREAREARRKLEDCRRELSDVKSRREAMEREEAALQDSPARYRELYARLLNERIHAEGPQGPTAQLNNVYLTANAQRVELEEALEAGKQALLDLENSIDSLSSAKDWGVMDMLLEGGFISNMVKYDKLDEAQAHAYKAQQSLTAFQKELSDVHIDELLQVEITGFLKFADWFFDGFFADWAALSKIKESLENVTSVRDRVAALVEELRQAHEKASQSEQEAGEALDAYLMESED